MDRRIVLGSLIASVALLAAAAPAAATTRFAAPGGTATAAQCTTATNPCTIDEAATGTGVVPADEVVIAPGSYSDTAGDLGASGFVNPIAQNIHGSMGQPRPVITLDTSHAFGAISVGTGVTVSNLSIQSVASDRAINVNGNGAVLDGVIARGTGSFGAACEHTRGIIRNSACISTASGGTAVGVSVGTADALTPTLRNVTAIATGSSSFGASYRVSGGGSISLSAKGVIAQGSSADLRAGGTDPSTSTITIDHSNFVTTSVLAGGTITDGGDNQSTPPMLAADNVHQLAGSPTINAGAVDGSSGTTDVDGQSRTLGTAPDIGADELGNSTSTAIVCLPDSVPAGSATTCTLTVTDDAATGATTPTGSIGLTSDTAGGTVSSGGSCALVSQSANEASCELTYTPGQVGTGTHQLTAQYVGDSTHEPSQTSAGLGVTTRPTSTAISCAPPSVFVGSATTCTATVTDTGASDQTTPTGSVEFGSDTTGGSFGSGGSCALAGVSPSQASCQLAYTPGQVGTGTHEISGEYGGDATHAASEGETLVSVATAPPPPGPEPGVPPSLVPPATTTAANPECATLRAKLKKAKAALKAAKRAGEPTGKKRRKVRKLRGKLRALGC